MSAWEQVNPDTLKPTKPFDFTEPIREPARGPLPQIPEEVEED